MGKRIINNEGDRLSAIEFLKVCDITKPVIVEISEYKKKRTHSQNSIYWAWMKILAKHFSTTAPPFSDNDFHDLMRFKFLGVEDKRIGTTEIVGQLVSTTELEPHGMSEYLVQIEAWAASHNKPCYLPSIACREYETYREARGI